MTSSKGGKPSRGTPADRRLAINRPKPLKPNRLSPLAPSNLASPDARAR
jgi:hypothetical protein